VTPAEQHAHDAARFAELADEASGADWDRRSPVAAWAARDVVGHLVEWLPEFLERADITLPAVDLAAGPADAWRTRAGDVQTLLETEGDRPFESPMFGVTTIGALLAQIYINDVWMHSWDLAKALGREPDLGAERCRAALAAMGPIEQLLRDSGQFGPAVPVPDGASAQDQFVAFIGRDPAWQPVGVESRAAG
jgi:uncharacterized protein (TIGR03086 family)